MKVLSTDLPGVLIVEPQAFCDKRGFFMESWNQARYEEHGLPNRFVQDNVSFSGCGVLRGLHFQHPQPQGKLVYVLQGEVFDVAVDIRRGHTRRDEPVLRRHGARRIGVMVSRHYDQRR